MGHEAEGYREGGLTGAGEGMTNDKLHQIISRATCNDCGHCGTTRHGRRGLVPRDEGGQTSSDGRRLEKVRGGRRGGVGGRWEELAASSTASHTHLHAVAYTPTSMVVVGPTAERLLPSVVVHPSLFPPHFETAFACGSVACHTAPAPTTVDHIIHRRSSPAQAMFTMIFVHGQYRTNLNPRLYTGTILPSSESTPALFKPSFRLESPVGIAV